MRNFSQYEKEVIKKIVDIDLMKSNIGEFIAKTALKNRGIKIDKNNQSIDLWYMKNDNLALNHLIEIVVLINYLEKNDLIFIHSNQVSLLDGNNKNWISNGITQEILDNDGDKMAHQLIPTNLYEHIVRYVSSYLFVGTELKLLCQNDFKSQEQINHEKEMAEVILQTKLSKEHHEKEMTEAILQTKLSKYSFWIAIIALAFSFCAPFFFDTTINKLQMEELNISNDKQIEVLNKIESEIKKSNELKDTITKKQTVDKIEPKAR